MTQSRTVQSEPRNAEAIASLLLALPGALSDTGAPEDWIGHYGYGCSIHPDLWYKPVSIKLHHLGAFLSQSSEQGIFIAGWSDMGIADVNGNIVIDVSHEGHVRIAGADPLFVERLAAHPALATSSVLAIGPMA